MQSIVDSSEKKSRRIPKSMQFKVDDCQSRPLPSVPKITEFLIHSFQQKREEAETRRNEDLRKKQTDKMPKVRTSAYTMRSIYLSF